MGENRLALSEPAILEQRMSMLLSTMDKSAVVTSSRNISRGGQGAYPPVLGLPPLRCRQHEWPALSRSCRNRVADPGSDGVNPHVLPSRRFIFETTRFRNTMVQGSQPHAKNWGPAQSSAGSVSVITSRFMIVRLAVPGQGLSNRLRNSP